MYKGVSFEKHTKVNARELYEFLLDLNAKKKTIEEEYEDDHL